MTAHQDALFEEPLYECTAYKSTKISDIVCQRNVRLYSNRVVTLHPTNTSEKVWYLSSGCTLSPEYREEIQSGSFSVRPPGSWSVTTKAAALAGGGSPPIELYCVTIHWPASWLATRGYTSFTLGFEEAREAAQWHSRVQRQISNLRMRSASSKGDASVGHSSKPSYDDRTLQWSNGGTTVTRKVSQDKGFVASALEHWLGSRVDKSTAQDESGVQAQPYRMPTSPVQIPIPSRPSSAPTSMEDADCGDEHAYGQRHCSDAGYASSDSGSPFPYPAAQEEQRWVPYRHTNGVAIYHQKQSKCSVWAGDEQGEGLGSEYMASSIVRGSPDECLAVLTDLSSNTTILGPASKIELLEDGDERQAQRFQRQGTQLRKRMWWQNFRMQVLVVGVVVLLVVVVFLLACFTGGRNCLKTGGQGAAAPPSSPLLNSPSAAAAASLPNTPSVLIPGEPTLSGGTRIPDPSVAAAASLPNTPSALIPGELTLSGGAQNPDPSVAAAASVPNTPSTLVPGTPQG